MKTLPRLAVLILAIPLWAQQYDVVLNNGRLIDPASNTDAIRSLGIRGGKIAAVSTTPLQGATVIDAHGLVIAPGFIDLHSHGQTPENYEFKARDGVTTALEMEVGVWPLSSWYAAREGKSLINFGASAGYLPALMSVMHDTGALLPRDESVKRAPTDQEWEQTLSHVRDAIQQGALGVGIGIAYTPLISREKILDLFDLASQSRLCLFIHIRNGGPVEPGVVDALQEVLADAAATGASLHVVHITSMALRQTPLCLHMIEEAHAHHVDVTTEAYPYTAGMTDLSSAVFGPGWQEHQGGITFHDLQWAATGERLTPETFKKYRAQGGMVAIHSIPEEIVRLAMQDPFVMVASDGILDHGKGHPRAAGSYARVLGRYVRDQHALTLTQAIRKMSYEPSQRLGITNKGRLAVNADADITVFDPEKVHDRATFDHPAEPSEGMRYVFVNGTLVVKDGAVQPNVVPGSGLRRLR
jgi:cytosine/adenosine deaminase-related metal-dependent hydrolase